jgi:glutathione S-transferase
MPEQVRHDEEEMGVLRIGPADEVVIEQGLEDSHIAAALLEAELDTRKWLMGDAVSYADFRMATFLPFNDVAELPISQYPVICRWYEDLCRIDAWREPFRGIDAPELPPVK